MLLVALVILFSVYVYEASRPKPKAKRRTRKES